MSLKSANYYSTTPLAPQRTFMGNQPNIPDNIQEYASAYISIYADTDCLLTVSQSSGGNGSIYTSVQYNSTAGTQFFEIINLQKSYITFTLKNTSTITAQTYLNFEVIYRPNGALSTFAQDVNVVNTSAIPVADAVLNACVSSNKVNVVDSVLDGCVASNMLNVKLVSQVLGLALDTTVQSTNTKLDTLIAQGLNTGAYVWGSASAPDTGLVNGDTSSIVNFTTKNNNTITYFGNASTQCTITIQYSFEGTVWFTSPQVFSIPAMGGDFSADTVSGAGYVRAILSDVATTVDITMCINHS